MLVVGSNALRPLLVEFSYQAKGDGVFVDRVGAFCRYGTARYSLDQITGGDGTTNTLMVTEKCGPAVVPQMDLFAVESGVFPPTGAPSSPRVVLLPQWVNASRQLLIFQQMLIGTLHRTTLVARMSCLLMAIPRSFKKHLLPLVYCQLITSNYDGKIVHHHFPAGLMDQAIDASL